MAKADTSFVRARCEGCGSALNPPDRTGRMICEYCGATYWSSQSAEKSAAAWQDPLAEIEREYHPVEVSSSAAAASGAKPNPVWKIGCFGLLVILMLGGAVIALTGMLSMRSAGSSRPAAQRQPKPEMLAALPVAPVMAGTPVNYANWGLIVEPQVSARSGDLAVTLTLTNYTESEQIFRYRPTSITVMDDRGNVYKPTTGDCQSDLLYLDRQLSISPNQTVEFSSGRNWCNAASTLPLYFGAIPLDATRIYILFDQFGLFTNLTVELGL